MMVCFYSRHTDENRRKHGEHVCLNKGYQYFHAIHEDAEQYGYNTHRCTDCHTHTSRNEYDTCQRQDNRVSGKDIGEQTDHQSKWLGEDTKQFDSRHQWNREFQERWYFWPKDFFPIFFGTEYIDCYECT